jgi:hypothetical protein
MSIAKNTIRFSDITTTPIKLKYSASFASSSLASNGITTNRGTNTYVSTSGSYTPTVLNYNSIRQLYYQNYLTGSVERSASFWDPQWQSTAASGSEDFQNSYFPNTQNSNISFMAIPTNIFGENIGRNSFVLESLNRTSYKIVDDGNGNLIDLLSGSLEMGNIFYSQGIATITHPDYVGILLDNSFTFTITFTLPSPSVTATVSTTPTVTPSITITPTITPTVTPTVTVSPTPSCARPSGSEVSFISGVSIGSYQNNSFSTGSLTDVCSAFNSYVNIPGTPTFGFARVEYVNLAVGEKVYSGFSTSCAQFNANGKFWLYPNNDSNFDAYFKTATSITVVTVTSGLISAIDTCNYIVPSITPTPTTTPSVTSTPIATPSITPTPTRTPSVTPSVTVTPSTSFSAISYTVDNPGPNPYPLTAASAFSSGTLTNNLGVTVYIYGVFFSAGNLSGNVNSDNGLVNSVSLVMGGTITSTNQTIYSSTYSAVNSASTVTWSLVKEDNLTSGAFFRLGYATTIGGPITII